MALNHILKKQFCLHGEMKCLEMAALGQLMNLNKSFWIRVQPALILDFGMKDKIRTVILIQKIWLFFHSEFSHFP